MLYNTIAHKIFVLTALFYFSYLIILVFIGLSRSLPLPFTKLSFTGETMSQQPATSDNTVSREEILDIANLARLGVDENTADSYAGDISKVLKLMNTLANVDTTDIKPTSQYP